MPLLTRRLADVNPPRACGGEGRRELGGRECYLTIPAYYAVVDGGGF